MICWIQSVTACAGLYISQFGNRLQQSDTTTQDVHGRNMALAGNILHDYHTEFWRDLIPFLYVKQQIQANFRQDGYDGRHHSVNLAEYVCVVTEIHWLFVLGIELTINQELSRRWLGA